MCRRIIHVELEATVDLCLERQRHLLIASDILDAMDTPLVFFFDSLLLADVVANLHLFFDQILGLDKGADELFTFFALENADLLLVNYVGDFKLLFFMLKFVLFVDKLLTQNALFIVQVQEDIQVLAQLVCLLLFDYLVNFACFLRLLLKNFLFHHFTLDFGLPNHALLCLELLSFPLNCQPALLLDQ